MWLYIYWENAENTEKIVKNITKIAEKYLKIELQYPKMEYKYPKIELNSQGFWKNSKNSREDYRIFQLGKCSHSKDKDSHAQKKIPKILNKFK